MKRRIFAVLLGLVLMLSMCGCGKDKKDEATESENVLQADIVEFVNVELPAITADRDNAIAIYNSYFAGDDLDKEQFLKDLKENAIPGMETFITNLQAVEVSTPEVEDLKNTYLLATQKQHEAMKMVALAIEGQTPDYLTQADALIVEAGTYMEQYETKLSNLAAANGITVKQ